VHWTTSDIPRSLWQTRGGEPRQADALVVGGGIVGLSAAFWLQRLLGADHRVVLLEAGSLACRASGRNAGFLFTGSAEPFTELARRWGSEAALSLWRRTQENRELVRTELLDGGRVDAGFLPEGSWHASLAGTGQEEALEESCDELRRAGLDCEWRDAAAVRKACGGRGLGGAIFVARDGGLDPVRLCRGLAEAGGFEVRTGTRVRDLEAAGGQVRVAADGGDWMAPRVVVALNAYAPVILPHLAADVRPVRGQMLATAPGERVLCGVWYVNRGHEYLRQLADGSVVLGGARLTAEHEEVGYLESPTAKVQGALAEFMRRCFPHLAELPVVHRWAGTMAFTPDGLPRVGDVPGVPGAVYAAGFNGHGMSLGFVSGRHLARRAVGQEVGELLAGAVAV